MAKIPVPQSHEDEQDRSLENTPHGTMLIVKTDEQAFPTFNVQHQQQVLKSSGFKPVKNEPGLAILCPESPPSAGMMKQVATAERLRMSGSTRRGLLPTGR